MAFLVLLIKKMRPKILLLFFVLLLPGIFFAADGAFAQSGVRAATPFYKQGQEAMIDEDWYTAAEDFLECLKLNPAHSEATADLAECYYQLGEYDEALKWVKKARVLARTNTDAANLEAFILIALGRLPEAEAIIKDTLSKEPYNRETLFAAAELDIASGHSGLAAQRFKNAVRLYPDDRRILLSLALVLGSLGDYTTAENYLKRAKTSDPVNYKVFYFSALLEGRNGKVLEAINDVQRALDLRPGFEDGLYLLATLRYGTKDYPGTIKLADEVIAKDRNNFSAWFLKGMSLWKLRRLDEALNVFENAITSAPNDEFLRAALEELLIESTELEDPKRPEWAAYHFKRAKEYQTRFLNDNAMFEYRRGLRINPYSNERINYAELLKTQGYPELYLEEMNFLQDLGKGNQKVNDAVETYTALLKNSLPKVWGIKSSEIKPHWNIAIFSLPALETYYHPDAASITASYIEDIMIHDRKVKTMNLPIDQSSFASAFRMAREAKDEDSKACDYFVILSLLESERELSIKAELYLARTGAKLAEFNVQRAGIDRLRNASINIVNQIDESLPFRGEILRRSGGIAVIDRGKVDGLKQNTVFNIVKKGRIQLKSDVPGFTYLPEDMVGTFKLDQKIDEEISAGELTRAGFFDLIEEGDELILPEAPASAPGAAGAKPANAKSPEASPEKITAYDPELRSLLMKLR